MKVGHKNVSETFLPSQVLCKSSGITYTDIAGQNDVRGDLIEFINLLLIKKIFNMAKKVRMLIIISHDDIKNCRGLCVRNQIELVFRILQGDIDKLSTSIIPIITKIAYTGKTKEA